MLSTLTGGVLPVDAWRTVNVTFHSDAVFTCIVSILVLHSHDSILMISTVSIYWWPHPIIQTIRYSVIHSICWHSQWYRIHSIPSDSTFHLKRIMMTLLVTPIPDHFGDVYLVMLSIDDIDSVFNVTIDVLRLIPYVVDTGLINDLFDPDSIRLVTIYSLMIYILWFCSF